MILLALFGADLDLPPRPAPPDPRPAVEGECLTAYAVSPAADQCGAVCLPMSGALSCLDTEDYVDHLEAHVRVLELEIRALRQELAASRSEAEQWRQDATRPAPLIERPVAGVAAGVGLCALSGWAVGQAGGR